MTKKWFWVLAAVLLLATVGLSAGGQKPAAEAEGAAEKQVLIYNSDWSDTAYQKADKTVVAMFQAENPNVKIIHSIIHIEDFKAAIRAYLVASPPPDVLTWYAGNRMRFFVNKGQILDISDVFEQEGWHKDMPPGFVSLSTLNDKQYFVPTNWYWWAIYYKKSIFENFGLEPPKTWDEFMEVCSTIKGGGISPITIGTKWRWTTGGWLDYLNMRVNGPDFHIRLCDGNESYADPKVKKVFNDVWAPMLKKGYFVPDASAYTWQEAVNLMVTDKAAMYLIGQFIETAWPEEMKDDLDFFQVPIIDPSVPIGEDAPTDGLFAPAGTENPEMAKKFLAFSGSVRGQEVWVKQLGRMATHRGVDSSLYTPVQRKGNELINTADFIAQFYDRDTTPPMADKGMDAFMEFWDNPDNANEILERLDEQRKDFFAQ
ncbi:MAG: extracellular solute-binding protein [Spirochaetaceae bacterium]|nr:MAG: extracellular solute-binding protein [Spirochaetaceae bacterium]